MTKKDIELPPLPVGTTSPMVHGAYYCASDMHDYARSTIKADRQQRGEPVGNVEIKGGLVVVGVDAEHLGDGVHYLYTAPQPAEVPFCEECGDGIMAHDPGICGTCYQTKYAAPQPADPAKDDSDALTVAYMSGFYDGKKAAELDDPSHSPRSGKGPFESSSELIDSINEPVKGPIAPECPYPCGWRQLYKIAVHDGAYLANSLIAGDLLTDAQRDAAISTSIRLIEVCSNMLRVAPEPPCTL